MTKQAPRLVRVDERSAGQRLDNYLLRELKALHQNTPKSLIYRIIRKGEVRVNKKRAKAHTRLKLDDQVRIPPVRIDAPETEKPNIPAGLQARIEAQILFEDAYMLVVNKPSGLAVHSGSQSRFGLIDAIRARATSASAELVHRLDKPTSGLLVLAKNRDALVSLTEQMRPEGAAKKCYQACVHGHWNPAVQSIRHPLYKKALGGDRHQVVVDSDGKSAHTQVLSVKTGKIGQALISLLTLQLHTGRTHQIRVHCQHEGHPLIGDDKYGQRAYDHNIARPRPGLMLHAQSLSLKHPSTAVALTFTAPMDESMKNLLEQSDIKVF